MPDETAQVLLKASDVLTKGDFNSATKRLIEILLQNQKRFNQALFELQQKYNALVGAVKADNKTSLQNLEKQVDKLFVEGKLNDMSKEQKKMFGSLKEEVSRAVMGKLKDVDFRVSKLKDGKTPVKGVDYFDGKDADLNKTLEFLKENLTIDSVKDLREILKKIASAKPMGRIKIPITRRIRLTDQVNGQRRTFNLGGRDVVAVYGLWGSQFPFTGDDEDFTLSGTELTLGSTMPTPERRQTLFVLVETLFYP